MPRRIIKRKQNEEEKHENLKFKLKANLESSKLMRCNLDQVYEKFDQFEKEFKKSTGPRKEYLFYLIQNLEEKLDNKEEKMITMEHGGNIGGGGGGTDGGSCAGSD